MLFYIDIPRVALKRDVCYYCFRNHGHHIHTIGYSVPELYVAPVTTPLSRALAENDGCTRTARRNAVGGNHTVPRASNSGAARLRKYTLQILLGVYIMLLKCKWRILNEDASY